MSLPATRALNEGDGKKLGGDDYASKNDKVSELWRPGAGFKPTTFLDPKGPKVPRPRPRLCGGLCLLERPARHWLLADALTL